MKCKPGHILETESHEINELGEGCYATAFMVDWLGNGGRDILYAIHPIYASAGIYLYREQRANLQRVPLYEKAEKLDAFQGFYTMPLVLGGDPGFHILTYHNKNLMLYRNTGGLGKPVFSASLETIKVDDVSLAEAISSIDPELVPATFSQVYNRERGVTDLIITARDSYSFPLRMKRRLICWNSIPRPGKQLNKVNIGLVHSSLSRSLMSSPYDYTGQ